MRHSAEGDEPAAEWATLLDQLVPTYDVGSRHRIWVAAAPARVYDVARHADLSHPWLVRLLMGLRVGPARLAAALRRQPAEASSADRRPSVGPVTFTMMAEAPGEEFVLGIMGRFWTVTGGLVKATAAQLRDPPPAGLAQGFWNFRVEPSGTGTTLTTETRVRCGDLATRRRFARYWRIIRLGSALIRSSLLRHIRLQAERPRTPWLGGGIAALMLGSLPGVAGAQRAATPDDFPGITRCESGQAISRIRADVRDSLTWAQLEAHESVHRAQAAGFPTCEAFVAGVTTARRIIDVELPAYCAQWRVAVTQGADPVATRREFAWRIAAQSGAMENRLDVARRFERECELPPASGRAP